MDIADADASVALQPHCHKRLTILKCQKLAIRNKTHGSWCKCNPFGWKTWQVLMPNGEAPFCWCPLLSTHPRGLAASGPCGAAWHTLVGSVGLENHIILVIGAQKSRTIRNSKKTNMVEVPVGQSCHLAMVLALVCFHEPLGFGGPVGTTFVSWLGELVVLWW